MLRVRPGERHGRARRPAAKELALGEISAVPDLLGNQLTLAGKAFHRRKQAKGTGTVCRGKLVMRALAGEQRPRTTGAGSVKGRTVIVLAVAVAIVAAPARA